MTWHEKGWRFTVTCVVRSAQYDTSFLEYGHVAVTGFIDCEHKAKEDKPLGGTLGKQCMPLPPSPLNSLSPPISLYPLIRFLSDFPSLSEKPGRFSHHPLAASMPRECLFPIFLPSGFLPLHKLPLPPLKPQRSCLCLLR